MGKSIRAELLPFSPEFMVVANAEYRGSEIPLKNKHPDNDEHQ
jgi:hypothetical protein